LNYTVQDFGNAQAGKQVYLNFEPGVNFGMAVTPSSSLSTPITGNLSAEAFGDTLVNYTFPIATPFNLPINYDEWDVNGECGLQRPGDGRRHGSDWNVPGSQVAMRGIRR
jgi:hypothetical protein